VLLRSIENVAAPQPSIISYGDDIADKGKMMASWVTRKQKTGQGRRLYRVAIRGQEYLGTAEEHHAKVVASDFLTAVRLSIEAFELDSSKVDGVTVTLLCEDCELPEGEVLDRCHRCRGFGERGGWLPDSARRARRRHTPE
jgi:hypothetical protein